MCARFTTTQDAEAVFSETGLSPPADWRCHYNVAPSQGVLAVRHGDDDTRQLATLRWGLLPSWANDKSLSSRLIMARAETVEEKPAYRDSFRVRRCALVADGFYEWRRARGGNVPFYFRFSKPLFIAGIWDRWFEQGETIESCAVLTTTANALVAGVHDRMPVLIGVDDLDVWLSPSSPRNVVRELLEPSPPEYLRVFAADRAVNNPANDFPQLLGDYAEEADWFGRAHP
ncbi:MAG: SOS response-associated peptidase [Deltaproteobacteria bacterium]|nr:SOS response-associated peptidase [Deltaproteobacteria bacterium]